MNATDAPTTGPIQWSPLKPDRMFETATLTLAGAVGAIVGMFIFYASAGWP